MTSTAAMTNDEFLRVYVERIQPVVGWAEFIDSKGHIIQALCRDTVWWQWLKGAFTGRTYHEYEAACLTRDWLRAWLWGHLRAYVVRKDTGCSSDDGWWVSGLNISETTFPDEHSALVAAFDATHKTRPPCYH